jgi:hypothetical protein
MARLGYCSPKSTESLSGHRTIDSISAYILGLLSHMCATYFM